jgi:hypothetical protein
MDKPSLVCAESSAGPTKFELAINLKTANAIDLTIPCALTPCSNEAAEQSCGHKKGKHHEGSSETSRNGVHRASARVEHQAYAAPIQNPVAMTH